MSEHTPVKKPKRKDEPPWMEREIKKSIEEKRRAWARWKETKRECDKRAYKKKEAETKKKIKNKKNAWERKIMECRKSNPKLFYSHVNRAKSTRSKVAPLINANGGIFIEPKEQANLLNRFYASVFTRSSNELPEPRQRGNGTTLDEILVTEERVRGTIEALKECSAAGPDEIPPTVIKQLKDELVIPITILFKKSIEERRIPDDWRESNVTPIYKQKGSRSDPGNYRPVSLTNVVGKMLERIVKQDIVRFIEQNKLMSNSQHGFRSGRSVQTNMTEFLDQTTRWLDKGRSFDIIYLDFAKAFDKVCHKRLILKLAEVGVGEGVRGWIENWLSGRRQRVKVEEEMSDWEDVVSGVLQGSVLGGVLFNIFIDDIDESGGEAFLRKFADDTKMAQIVETHEDGQMMQKKIDGLVEWADKWGMAFNSAKCKVMHCGNKNLQVPYSMDGDRIGVTREERDLGVIVGDTMKPSSQCASAARAGNFALGQLLRAFHYRRKANIVPLYKTFVRPRLEFAVTAWNPWTEADVRILERVQERLVRAMADVKGATYEEKLRDARLTTLRERRIRGDAIEAFKTLKRINQVEADEWFTIVGEEARPTRANTIIGEEGEERRELVLEVERANLELRRNFFTIRAAREWNKLPEEMKKLKTVNSFKGAYDAWKHRETLIKSIYSDSATGEDRNSNENVVNQ